MPEYGNTAQAQQPDVNYNRKMEGVDRVALGGAGRGPGGGPNMTTGHGAMAAVLDRLSVIEDRLESVAGRLMGPTAPPNTGLTKENHPGHPGLVQELLAMVVQAHERIGRIDHHIRRIEEAV